MGRPIIKIGKYYLEWSTICDAPRTFGMTLDEFKEYYLHEYGRDGCRDLNERLGRADEYGTSLFMRASAWDFMSSNRAGPNECELTFFEIYRAYCLRKPIRGGWLVPNADE